MIKSVVPELIVENMERSIHFYKDLLDFKITAQVPEIGNPVWTELENGSIKLMLQTKKETLLEIPSISNRIIGGTTILVFRLNSRDAVRNLASKLTNQVQIISSLRETDYGTVELIIADPDGYMLLFSGE